MAIDKLWDVRWGNWLQVKLKFCPCKTVRSSRNAKINIRKNNMNRSIDCELIIVIDFIIVINLNFALL